jgi:hypothetical protein
MRPGDLVTISPAPRPRGEAADQIVIAVYLGPSRSHDPSAPRHMWRFLSCGGGVSDLDDLMYDVSIVQRIGMVSKK